MIIRLYRAQPFSLVRLFTLFFILFSLFGELYCYFALCALAGPGDEGSTHLINRWPGPSGFFFCPFEVIMKSFGTKKNNSPLAGETSF